MKNETISKLSIGDFTIEAVIEDDILLYHCNIKSGSVAFSSEELEQIAVFYESAEVRFKEIIEEYEESRLLEEWFDSEEGIKEYEMERRYEYNQWARSR